MQVVVLTSGLSEPADADRAHPILTPLDGRPLVDWLLDRYVASGVRNVVMCVSKQHGEEIETHVRRALDRGLMVAYSYAGEQLAGSGGALRRCYARLEPEFLVTYGERYLPFDYSAPVADLRAHPDALGTLAVARRRPGLGRSRAAVDGEWVVKYDPHSDPSFEHLDCGAVALRRSVLQGIEDGAVWDIEVLLRKLARERRLRAFSAPEPPYDLESEVSREELERHLRRTPRE
jgi:N-acetyl-alpha-D-muramate 1-phosphate uridylyltransferase